MKWLLIVIGVFAMAVLALLIVGLMQPEKHSVTRSIHLNQKPETVFAVIENCADFPNWSSSIAKVEHLPDHAGKPAARFTLKWGHMQMIMTQLECIPPTRLVSNMAKEDGTVLGAWTYQITPEAGGCRVAITEVGELKNPIFRLMARMRGLDANLNQTLRDLAKKFGESANVQ